MRSNRLSLAAAALAASAGAPLAAGAAELPSFSCGSSSAITWASGFSSQPTFFDAVTGASGDVGCNGTDFLHVIGRKSGEGQKDFLKITLAEAFVDGGDSANAEIKFDLKIFHKLVDIPGAPGDGHETYFDLTQFVFNSDAKDPFAEVFLGLKITTLHKFDGKISFKWDSESQALSALIPLQEDDAVLSLTSAPSNIPEPETWALLTTGLVGMGAVMRRRRARAW